MIRTFLEWWLGRIDASEEAERNRRFSELESRIERLAFDITLLEAENLSLSRQLETAIDTVQAFGLHNRAIGAEAKTYTDYLSAQEK